MSKTTISWAEQTWNPLTGCDEISPGCANCYAAKMARRLEAMGQEKYKGTTKTLANGKTVWTGKINLVPEALTIPLRVKKPTMWFVNSMSDLFHKDVPDWFIFAVWETMARTPWHTYQVLTKRAERLPDFLAKWSDAGPDDVPPILSRDGVTYREVAGKTKEQAESVLQSRRAKMFFEWTKSWGEPPEGCVPPTYDWMEGPRWLPDVLPNVWLGVSVEDQQRADERIPHLLKTPAAIRFLSCEPLLGPVDLQLDAGHETGGPQGWVEGPKPDWVIIGGESGKKDARPCDLAWIRSLVQQCQQAGVAAFVKQLGSKSIEEMPALGMQRLDYRDPKGGDINEFPGDLRVRQFPQTNME